MKIKFDPEHTDVDLCFLGSRSRSRSKSRSMSGGGGFTKAQRCEYMDLCRQMTSRDPAQVTRANRDRLLAYLKDYVVEHSATYPEKREFIMTTVPVLFENPAMLEDPNFLGSYNLVAFQCSILFTIVSMNMSPEDLEICMLYNQLQRYELNDLAVLDYVKTKRPLRESTLLTGLDPAMMDKLESTMLTYMSHEKKVHLILSFSRFSNIDIRTEVSKFFRSYPEVSTVTNESLEFLRKKMNGYADDLNKIIDYIIAPKYNISGNFLTDNEYALYFSLFRADIWNNYAAIRDVTIKRQIGVYMRTSRNHTGDMSIDIDTKNPSTENELILYRLYSTDYRESQPLYLITIISYIYIQEFVDAIVHNVYYCGLAYKLQKADGRNHYPYHFLIHDYIHGTDSLTLFTIKPRMYYERLYTLIMRTTFNKDIRYSILLMLFYILHEDSTVIYNLRDSKNPIRSIENSLDYLLDERWYDTDDLLLSIPKVYRESKVSIDAYLTLSFKRFYEYFQAVQAMNDPLPNHTELSGSAKKLLDLYLDKEVSVSGSPNVNKMKRLLQTRKVAKKAAKKARKSKSRSHS